MQITFKDVSSAMAYCLAASNWYKHAAEQDTKIFNNLVEQVWEENKHNLIKKKWWGLITKTYQAYYYTDIKDKLTVLTWPQSGGISEVSLLSEKIKFEQAQAEVLEARYNALKTLQDNGHECSVTIDIVGEK